MRKKSKKKKDIVNFTGRNHSIKGMLSLTIGIVIAMAIIILMFTSSFSGGNGGLWYGYAGFGLAFLSILGFVLGAKGCKDKDIYYTAPISGIILNGVLFLIFIILYLLGIVI
jgi:hypothetical protein